MSWVRVRRTENEVMKRDLVALFRDPKNIPGAVMYFYMQPLNEHYPFSLPAYYEN